MQKIAAPFVGRGPLFVGAPVRPNMLNMHKSAAATLLQSAVESSLSPLPKSGTAGLTTSCWLIRCDLPTETLVLYADVVL